MNADALSCYTNWPKPDCIVSDGAYGVSGFIGDTLSPSQLTEWYQPHIELWAQLAKPSTTLWFWNTEIGWANVHPFLEKCGWEYVSTNIWNKGLQHIAGNCNLRKLKNYPIVSEICVQYVRKKIISLADRDVALKDWLRMEWDRTGLKLSDANKACDLASAASRKYITRDHLWYPPPPEHFESLVTYANKYGVESGRPYFIDRSGVPLSVDAYSLLFPKFNGVYGITNVWDHPPLHNNERMKQPGSNKYFHYNQKPLALMSRIIECCSDVNDVVWEPFGGLFTGSMASFLLKRKAYGSEVNSKIFVEAIKRFVKQPTQAPSQIYANATSN